MSAATDGMLDGAQCLWELPLSPVQDNTRQTIASGLRRFVLASIDSVEAWGRRCLQPAEPANAVGVLVVGKGCVELISTPPL